MSQLSGGHARITDGEVETISNRFIKIFVIHYIEVVTTENLLQFLGTLTIDTDLLTEVVLAFVGGFQHGCQGILGTVART